MYTDIKIRRHVSCLSSERNALKLPDGHGKVGKVAFDMMYTGTPTCAGSLEIPFDRISLRALLT